MDKLFRHIIPKTVIDIGAHVGDFSKQIYFKNPECKIIMVEGNPNCEAHLRLLGKPYDITALSDKVGFADLYIEKINSIPTGASFYKENTQWYSEGKYDILTVPTCTLDDKNYFENLQIDLIKLDVQGAELDILNGGEKTLNRTQYVLIETSLVEYNLNAPLMDEIVNKMNEYKFVIVDIIDYLKAGKSIIQLDLLFKRKLYL